MRWVLCAFIVAGCATAGKSSEQHVTDASGDDDDAAVPIDAPPPIDAPVMATLSETLDSTVKPGTSIACLSNDGNNSMKDTNYYRVYQLSDFNVTGPFHVQSLQVPIEEANGNVSANFFIGTYSGGIGGTTLDMAKFTQLATTSFAVPNSASAETLTVPLIADLPAGAVFLVYMAFPTQSANQHYALLGATVAGETHPAYYSSTTCGDPIQTSVAIGMAGQWILNVVGTH